MLKAAPGRLLPFAGEGGRDAEEDGEQSTLVEINREKAWRSLASGPADIVSVVTGLRVRTKGESRDEQVFE